MKGTDLGSFGCDEGKGQKTAIHDNHYYTPTGDLEECKMSLKDWQSLGHDTGSQVSHHPSNVTIIGWARSVLGF